MMRMLLAMMTASHLVTGATLEVRCYNLAGVPESVLNEARAAVRAVFHNARIEVDWHDGNPDSEESTIVIDVAFSRPSRESERECRARRDIVLRLVDDIPAPKQPNTLGFSLPHSPEGVDTTVFYNRAKEAAVRYGTPVGRVLGYAIAHEIGHVLLRSNLHSDSGVMAGVWGERQYDLIRRGMNLLFHSSEATAARITLDGEGCRVPGAK